MYLAMRTVIVNLWLLSMETVHLGCQTSA
uniref:Uncharacterized protein n=1 Tax=Arundo donax TaxID=35708 RepID=A0A0A8XVQ7_ARUDO